MSNRPRIRNGKVSGRAWKREANSIAQDNKAIAEMNMVLLADIRKIEALARNPGRLWRKSATLIQIAEIAGAYTKGSAPKVEENTA
jgi:hypothetical protein